MESGDRKGVNIIKKNITMKDIAVKLNTSTVTVSKALANKPGVSENLRKNIKDIAGEMGYRCNIIAKGMKEGCTYNIGVIVAQRYMEAGNSFYFMMYNNIVKHLSCYNYYAIIEIINKENELKCQKPNMILDNRIDALIILGQMDENYINLISKQNIPTVFLDFYDRHFEVDSVVGDNIYGAYTITNYLIDKGHTEIGYVGNIYSNRSILDRYLGYCKTLIENNITIKAEWVINDRDCNGGFFEFNLPENLPTAFVCNCDETAYYFIRYLEKNFLKVPDDISIVGFDNYIHAKICKPGITTIQVDTDKMAKETVENILKKIEDEKYSIGRKMITGKVIIRDSVKEIYKKF